MPKYPWAVRAGGPLLQGGGGALPVLFGWNPETAQTLPATSTFTRASIAQVLTTTDGTTNWYQEAKSGELRLDGLRRVETLTPVGVYDGTLVWSETGSASISHISNGEWELTVSSTGNSQVFYFTSVAGTSGQVVLGAVEIRQVSGPAANTIRITPQINSTSGFRDLTTVGASYRRFSTNQGIQAGDDEGFLLRVNTPDSTTRVYRFRNLMVERWQFGTTIAPSDLVRPDVELGRIGVDGVAYLVTENGNSVDGNGVVTEATGAAITGGGYLPEPAATNRLLHSNDMTNAAWVGLGAATPTDLGITDIGGMTTRVSGLGALGVDDIAQSVGGFTASGAVAPSVLLRRNSTTGTLRISSVGGLGNGEWQVDLSLIGPGWVRLEPGATVPGFSEFTPWVADGAGNAGVVYSAVAGGPLTVDLAFNKTENTTFATSPIITRGIPVTREADSLTDVDWPATASAVIDTTVNNVIPGGTIDNQQNMLGFGSNSAHSFVLSAPTVARIFTGGINSFITAGSSYESERHGFGMSFQVNEGIVVDDEDNDNTDVTGTPGGGTIQIGLNSGLVGVPGKYHRIRIYDQTQTVEELKAEV